MPDVLGKKFPYDPEGIKAAEEYAEEQGVESPLGKRSGFKMKGWSAFTKPDKYEPQTKTRKDISTDITPQTQYPKVGDELKVKDYAGSGLSSTGKIMSDDKEGSYEYNSETKTWTKTSDTGGKRSSN